MAKPDFDITMLGDKELERMLAQLPSKSQRTVVRGAIGKSTKRIHRHLIQYYSGSPVSPHTGRLLTAIAGSEVKYEKRRWELRYGVALPTRAALGIAKDDPYYYPAILEYGTPHLPPKRPMRRAVDDNAKQEIKTLGNEIGKGIERTARRLGVHVR